MLRKRSSTVATAHTRTGLTHMLLYLNEGTYTQEEGERLADEVRGAMLNNVPLVMVHENDATKGGCEFSTFFRTTPEDLIRDGLYKKLALAAMPPPLRDVSLALIAKEFGATTQKNLLGQEIQSSRRLLDSSGNLTASSKNLTSTANLSSGATSKNLFKTEKGLLATQKSLLKMPEQAPQMGSVEANKRASEAAAEKPVDKPVEAPAAETQGVRPSQTTMHVKGGETSASSEATEQYAVEAEQSAAVAAYLAQRVAASPSRRVTCRRRLSSRALMRRRQPSRQAGCRICPTALLWSSPALARYLAPFRPNLPPPRLHPRPPRLPRPPRPPRARRRSR